MKPLDALMAVVCFVAVYAAFDWLYHALDLSHGASLQ
jgi:hypothetical protein